MTVQAGLCQTCSETTLLVFPRGGSNSGFRQDTETILRNSDADFIDTEQPELNADADRDGSESYQTARTLPDIDNDSIDDPASVSYDRVASWQLHRPNSSRIEDTISERRLPKSRSLPQGLGGTEQPERCVPRNTYSFHEDLQVRIYKNITFG